MFRKPWRYSEVQYSDVFWRYANETEYADTLKQQLAAYSAESKAKDLKNAKKMEVRAKEIMRQDIKFGDIINSAKLDFSGTDSESESTQLGFSESFIF